MCKMNEMWAFAEAAHRKETGRTLTEAEYKEIQNEMQDRLRKKDSIGYSKQCSCGKVNQSDANYCCRCGLHL